jgi:hypothetical protein
MGVEVCVRRRYLLGMLDGCPTRVASSIATSGGEGDLEQRLGVRRHPDLSVPERRE